MDIVFFIDPQSSLFLLKQCELLEIKKEKKNTSTRRIKEKLLVTSIHKALAQALVGISTLWMVASQLGVAELNTTLFLVSLRHHKIIAQVLLAMMNTSLDMLSLRLSNTPIHKSRRNE